MGLVLDQLLDSGPHAIQDNVEKDMPDCTADNPGDGDHGETVTVDEDGDGETRGQGEDEDDEEKQTE